jgi:hypothetical protein
MTCIHGLGSSVVDYVISNMTNPWYDKECKIARKSIRDASNESLKLDKINTYKSLIKRKKMYYINKRQEQAFTTI